MSSVPTDGPYDLYVPSGDHRPPHVHVEHDGDEAVFHVLPYIELRDNYGIPDHELTDIRELIVENRTDILKKWVENCA